MDFFFDSILERRKEVRDYDLIKEYFVFYFDEIVVLFFFEWKEKILEEIKGK